VTSIGLQTLNVVSLSGNIMHHETVIVPYTFPLLAVKLKQYKKQLSDAVWEEDQKRVELLTNQIYNIEVSIALGEKYDVPF